MDHASTFSFRWRERLQVGMKGKLVAMHEVRFSALYKFWVLILFCSNQVG